MDEWVAQRTASIHVCNRAQLAADHPLPKTRVSQPQRVRPRTRRGSQDSVHRAAAKKRETLTSILAAAEYQEMSDRGARFVLEAFASVKKD